MGAGVTRVVSTQNLNFRSPLNCSLISFSKLLKQTNCFALLTDTLCILLDPFTRTLIGAGEEQDGVYFFKDGMAVRVHVDGSVVRSVDQFQLHQRLGHPSFSVLSALPLSLVTNITTAHSPCDTFSNKPD